MEGHAAGPRWSVVFDGRWTRADSGIGQYGYWLARTLPAVLPDHAVHVLLPGSQDPLVQDLMDTRYGHHPIRVAPGPANPIGVAGLVRRLRRLRPAIYHAPDWMALPSLHRLGWRSVATIHDLIPLVHREWVAHSRKARLYPLYAGLVARLARRMDAVVTDSALWAAEIPIRLGVDPDRVHVVPLGVAEPRPVSAAEVKEVRRRFGIGDAPYVLAVGRREPYKGFVELVEAFAKVRREEVLVLVGRRDPRYPEVEAAVGRLGLAGVVREAPVSTPRELEGLYEGAAAFVTLSRAEGFGLPPLEAMARGVPTIATRCSVFPEVLGDAAEYVDPDDGEQVGRTLRRVLDVPGLRDRLRERGLAQSRIYRWEDCARKVAGIYRSLMQA